MTRFTMLVLTALCASACGGNSVRYVEVPGDGGVAVEQCSSDDQCGSDGSCDLETGYCVRVEVVERVVEHGEVCNGRDDNGDGYADEGLLAFSEPEIITELGCARANIASDMVATDTGHAFLLLVGDGEQSPSGRCAYYPSGTWRLVTEDGDGEVALSEPFLAYRVGSGQGAISRDLVWTGSGFGVLVIGIGPEFGAWYLVAMDQSAAVQYQVKIADWSMYSPRPRLSWTGTSFVTIAPHGSMDDANLLLEFRRYLPDGTLESIAPYGSQRAGRDFSVAPMNAGGYLEASYPARDEVDPRAYELVMSPLAPDFNPSGVAVATIRHSADLIVRDLMPTEEGFLLPADVGGESAYAARLDREGGIIEEFTSRPGRVQLVSGNTAIGVGNNTAFRFSIDGERLFDGDRLPDQGFDGKFSAVGDAKYYYYFVDRNVVFDSGPQPKLMRSRFGCSE